MQRVAVAGLGVRLVVVARGDQLPRRLREADARVRAAEYPEAEHREDRLAEILPLLGLGERVVHDAVALDERPGVVQADPLRRSPAVVEPQGAVLERELVGVPDEAGALVGDLVLRGRRDLEPEDVETAVVDHGRDPPHGDLHVHRPPRTPHDALRVDHLAVAGVVDAPVVVAGRVAGGDAEQVQVVGLLLLVDVVVRACDPEP